MPAYYAHRRFGELVTEQLPGEMRDIIGAHREVFLLGCQGPDIYFFYRPWSKNEVNLYGERLHDEPAKGLIERGVKIIRRFGRESAKAAYVYGVVCHFALDSECHPYVDEMEEKLGVKHIEIEEEFEKYLMSRDGRNPFSTDLSRMVPTDRKTVDAVKPLYPEMTWRQTRESLLELRAIKKIVCQPTAGGQECINRLLKKAGLYEVHKGQMNQMVDNLKCLESNAGLAARFDAAVDVATDLIDQVNEAVDGKKELGVRFERSFA